MEEGTQVKITSDVRKGKIGTFIRKENTAIGELYRIEFDDGSAGLYTRQAFVIIS